MIQGSALDRFLEAPCVLVEIVEAAGSTPREAGTLMLVSAEGLLGTIGGGQLEHVAMTRARQILAGQPGSRTMEVPLGPEIGQCCGGHVTLDLRRVDEPLAHQIRQWLAHEQVDQPHLLIFGAGHVGRALAMAAAPLPLNVTILDTRADTLGDLPSTVATRVTALPEADVRAAPAGSAFVVLTHDHALDFLITREVLLRGDASYCGLIGSKTKRARFASWFRHEGGAQHQLEGLTCPIGGNISRDKRPEVIAALTVAEVLTHLSRVEPARGQSVRATMGAT